ncbi:MAG: S41 family peptidase, partial [Candidatus Limnocylindrales bacterium]
MAARSLLSVGLITVAGALSLGAAPGSVVGTSIRTCDLIPGRSVPASMPPGIDGAPARLELQKPVATGDPDEEVVERQGRIVLALARVMERRYLYPEALEAWGNDALLPAAELIAQGIDERGFEALLDWVMQELGDDHSYIESPEDAAEADAAEQGRTDFVGMGVWSLAVRDLLSETISAVHADSPAERAGLRPHDTLISVDGKPFVDEHGNGRSRGPEGTSFTLTYERPGEGVREATLVRRRVTSSVPVDACLVAGTRVGYIQLPTFFQASVDDQVRDAIVTMTANGPLDGLVLDDRMNQGGLGIVLDPMLGMFTGGRVGAWVGRDGSEPIQIRAEDVGGSQNVPLVVLVGPQTNSFAEIFAGVLQAQGRATLVGSTTPGNVEELYGFDLRDGWRVRVATDAFRPFGGDAGAWEHTGIVPDIAVPARWDLFTEATDP